MKENNNLRDNNLALPRYTNGEHDKVQSLQDKTGATAEQIRKAIEQVGFDREKVEQYLLGKWYEA